MTLAEQNAALIEKSMGMLSDEVKAVYGENQKHVEAQEHLKNALGVGDTAPMFELPDADGNTVSLAEVLKNGPAVVSFYRGAWCPFCNLELRAMQQELANASAANVTLVAISPNTPDISADFAKEIEVTFPVLSDVDNVVAKQFNLVFGISDGLIELMTEQGRDLTEMNGSQNWELPIPATYVIDQSGVIQFAFVDTNHRARAEPSEVVAIAAAL